MRYVVGAFLFFVKDDSNPLNMINQIRVAYLIVERQINGINQVQIIQLRCNAMMQIQIRSNAWFELDSQINIRAFAIITLRSRTIQYNRIDWRILVENCLDFTCYGLRQTCRR